MKEQTDKNFCALYWLLYSSINIAIPKKNGRGYLKAAFGGHHINKVSEEWDDIKPEGAGDICDIDGYLQIELSLKSWEKGYNKLIENIKKSLQTVFPNQIDSWKELNGDDFIEAIS